MSSSKGNSAAPIDGVPLRAETESIAVEPDAVEATSEAGPAQDGRGCDEEPRVLSPGPDAVNPTEEAMEPDPLECLRTDLAKTRDQLLRTAADFDNYRKRSRREIIDSDRQGRESVLRELLPVFDNLERAVAHAETSTDTKSVADGVRLVVQQFLDTIAKIGVERLQSLGQPFDPSLHDAIQSLETTEFPAGTITAEILPGYKMGDRLVRPALVVVAKRPAETPPASAPNDGGSAGKDSVPPG